MGFAGVKKPDERANLIAYLRTLSDSPAPLPERCRRPAAETRRAPADAATPPSASRSGASSLPRRARSGRTRSGDLPAAGRPAPAQ